MRFSGGEGIFCTSRDWLNVFQDLAKQECTCFKHSGADAIRVGLPNILLRVLERPGFRDREQSIKKDNCELRLWENSTCHDTNPFSALSGISKGIA